MKTLITLTATIISLVGCASAPKAVPVVPAPVEQDNGPIAVIKLEACQKPYVVFVISHDGTIHEASASQLTKEELNGIDELAAKLPDDNAGQLTIPCVPTLDTHL